MSRVSRLRSLRAAGLCAALTTSVALGALLFAPLAAAATVVSTATIAAPGATARGELSAGGSSTVFTVALPANASCPADTAHHGYRVYSYLEPKGSDLSAVRFIDFPSRGYGMVDPSGRYYGAINTALGTGQIVGIPNDFEWGPLVRSVPLSRLVGGTNHGVWEAGIACATTRGALARYWNTQVTFTADAGDARGFAWHAVPGPPAGSPSPPAAPTRHAAGRGAGSTSAASSARATAGAGSGTAATPGSTTGAGAFWSASGGAAAPPSSNVPGSNLPGGSGGGSGGTAGGGTVGSPAVSDVPLTAAACAGVLALAVGLLFLLRRNWRTGRPAAARGSVR